MASDFELAVMKELSEIKSRATSADVNAQAAKDASIAATQAMTDRLFHPQSGVITVLQADIKEIKEERVSDARWERFHNVAHYSLPPIMAFLHGIVRHFGIDV